MSSLRMRNASSWSRLIRQHRAVLAALVHETARTTGLKPRSRCS